MRHIGDVEVRTGEGRVIAYELRSGWRGRGILMRSKRNAKNRKAFSGGRLRVFIFRLNEMSLSAFYKRNDETMVGISSDIEPKND